MSEPVAPDPRASGDIVFVVGLAVLAATLAVVVQAVVFPHGSINNDEAIYRLQGQALQHGHLFSPVLTPEPAFRPWLAAVVGHHWVLKYVPVEAGLLAVAATLTGAAGAALPVVAAAFAVATWLLVREVLDDRRAALVATLLVVLSPLVVVQSALLVGYLPTLALLEFFAWSVLRTTRRLTAGRRNADSRRATILWALLGGLALGLAGIARPYDTALFALPVGAWAVLRLRRQIVGPLVWYAIGALPSAAVLLVYDWAATGSPLRLTFNLLEPADRPGFGLRRMYPQEGYHSFGLRSGVRGSATHLLLTVGWVAGGPVLVLLAIVGIWRRRRCGPAVMLAAAGAAFPLGYVFFWGAWNAAQLWRGIRYIGPFYFLPLVLPIAAFGGAELAALFRHRRVWAVLVVAAGLVSSAAVAGPALAADARWSRQDGAVLALVDRHVSPSDPGLVLIESDQSYLMHPISGLANRWDGSGPLRYALWSGTARDLTVTADEANRRPYLLTLFGPFQPHPAHLAATLRPVVIKTGAEVTVHVAIPGTPPGSTLTVQLAWDGAPAGASLPCPPAAGGWDVTVTADGTTTCMGPAPPRPLPVDGSREGSLVLVSSLGARLSLPVRLATGAVTLLTVGPAAGVVGAPPAGQLTAE